MQDNRTLYIIHIRRALTDKARAYFSYNASNYAALKDFHQAP